QVSLCHNIARLIPRTTAAQACKSCTIDIDPQPEIINEYEDFYGNKVIYFAIQEPHEKLIVTVTSELAKNKQTAIQLGFYGSTPWEEAKTLLYQSQPDLIDARQYIFETPMTASSELIKEYAATSFTTGRPMFEACNDLMSRIFKDFKFESGATSIATPLSEVMEHRKGVCQDFAHLAIACVRTMGLPARYMSGYIETLPPEGEEKLVGVDASHAWFSVYIPSVGWVEFDPTNNVIPSDQHLLIGWGRDYEDINPLKGIILSNGEHELKVSVDVRRIA
ncbi:MAG: transglutaminase family protein, partial [Cytophagales bacterium]|nr:transglutaminase family protein [Cytophaga sp.]